MHFLLRCKLTKRGLKGSLPIIVVHLSSYKYGDVGNLPKFAYLIRIVLTFADARKYDLTSSLRLFRPVMKVKYISNCK